MIIYDEAEIKNGKTMCEIANLYGITEEEVETICVKYGLGLRTREGVLWFTDGNSDKDHDISMFDFYYHHKYIEMQVLEYIKENQPTTITRISNSLDMSKEKVWHVVDRITYKDKNLYEDSIGKTDFLFYGSEK
jgi:hypothetical protein